MKCEYVLCIYKENGQCTVSEVSINTLGMCDGAITATIPPEDLLRYKTETLVSIERSWEEDHPIIKGDNDDV